MSRKFLTPIDLGQQELRNAVVQVLGAAPGTPVAGQTYYDTTAAFTLIYNGTIWVDARQRNQHLGTQVASTISNLAATVQAYTLNQFAVPTANVAFNGFKATGLATPTASGDAATWDFVTGRALNTIAGTAATSANVPMSGFKFTGLGTPSVSGDSATYDWTLSRALSSFTGAVTANVPMAGFKFTGLGTPTIAGDSAEFSWVLGQIQSSAAGIVSKGAVTAVATTNIATLSGLPTVDGITFTVGQRLLLTGQNTPSQNGPWVVGSGAWTRPVTEGATAELDLGAMWFVEQGTANAATQWRMTNTGAIVVATTSINIVQFGAASVYTANNGVVLSGSNFSAVAAPSGGLTVAAAGISVDTTVARNATALIGDGTTLALVVTHNLGKQAVLMQVFRATTPFDEVECDMAATSTTTATFTFAVAPTVNQFRATMIG